MFFRLDKSRIFTGPTMCVIRSRESENSKTPCRLYDIHQDLNV